MLPATHPGYNDLVRMAEKRCPRGKERGRLLVLAALALVSFQASVFGEVIYLHNGDILHGTVIGASEGSITLQTAYGNLVIPKTEIRQIDYKGSEPAPAPPASPPPEETPSPPEVGRVSPSDGQSVIAIDIQGDSFWYAFSGSPDEPADSRIRLRLFVAGEEVAVLQDAKYDTVDKDTRYNSFTFAPADTEVIETAEGYHCRVEGTSDGGKEGVLLILGVPETSSEQRTLLRMLYQVNEGSEEFPRWTDAISRSFPVPLEAGRETRLVIQQDATGFDYIGFFRKTMKNLESFQIRVVSSEVRNPS